MNRRIIAIIVLGFILLACLLACGFFGVKSIRRTRLRRAALEAYEKKDYILAERLLHAYVQQDPNAEAEFVALANIYHELGNTGMEAQMWQTASSLNPLNPEYWDKMLTSAMKSANYTLLHGILGRKARSGEKLTNRELYLFVIASYRIGDQKDGDDAYQKVVKANPEAFHKNDLGSLAEFMAKYADLSEADRNNYLEKAMESEDPIIRFEALYIAIRRMEQQNVNDAEYETKLKQLVEINYFVGTQLLADFYFSKYRFEDVCSVLEPYLKTIDDVNLYLLYAETCVFMGRLDELKALEKKLRRKSGLLRFMADYCEILIAFLEEDEEKLVVSFRKSGKLINSPLSRFIRLRVGTTNRSFNEILAAMQDIISNPPFRDLTRRATLVCLNYIANEMLKPENQKDLSQLAELAKLLSGYLPENPMLTEIILLDQYKKGLVKEEDLMAALTKFPDDPQLIQITAEFLVFNGKAEQALSLIEQSKGNDIIHDSKLDFLHMLALDQLEQHDEAAAIFQNLVEQSKFDLNLLSVYFKFSCEHKHTDDLNAMADKLENATDSDLKRFAVFFRAAAALLTDSDEAEKTKALDLLAASPDDDLDFMFYAANRLSEADRLDEAEAKYKAILKTNHATPLVYVNLSLVYHAKGETEKAIESAKTAYDLEKRSMLPAYIYAQRLSEAKRYEEAVGILNFPHHAVNYRKDIVELWGDCMHHVIENSIAGERYMQAEEQCKHLLTISPDDEFGKENLEKVQKLIRQQNVKGHSEQTAPAA